MPIVGATFEPAAPPGAAIYQGLSAMDRATQMRLAQQSEERRQQEFEQQQQQFQAVLPAIQAKSAADIVTQKAAISHAVMLQGLRAKMAVESQSATNEYLAALGMNTSATDENGVGVEPKTDWNEMANDLAGVATKYNWMSLLPEGQAFLNQVKESAAHAQVSALTMQKSNAEYDKTKMIVEGRQGVEDTKATTRIDATGQVVAGREAVAQTQADARIGAAGISAQAHSQADVNHLKNLEDAANQALTDGDVDQAAAYKARIYRISHGGVVPKTTNTSTGSPQRASPQRAPIQSPVSDSQHISFNGSQPTETPAEATPVAAPASTPIISSQQDLDRLPKGSRFIWNGRIGVKK